MIIIIMGVSGAGKTTVGRLLAKELGLKFYDADDFHSVANKDKMSRGVALTDEDRADWLMILRNLLNQNIEANSIYCVGMFCVEARLSRCSASQRRSSLRLFARKLSAN